MYINKEISKIQKEFVYLYEIIRGDYYLSSNIDGINFILKLVYFRLMTLYDKEIRYEWNDIVQSGKELNRSYGLNIIERIEFTINTVIHNFGRLSDFRTMKLSNFSAQTINTLSEIITFLDKLNIEYVGHDIRMLADIFYMVVLKLLPLGKQYRLTKDYVDENISMIISNIVNIKKGDSIFDPYIGTGSLIYKILRNVYHSDLKIIGQDINIEELEICSMLMNLLDIDEVELECGDSIKVLNNSNSKFDKIITHIPYNLRYYDRLSVYNSYAYSYAYDNGRLKNGNYIIITQIISMLSYKGEAYIVVPNNVLYSGGDSKEIRRNIIKDDIIEAVIEFSEYSGYNGVIKPVILVLNKKKESYKKGKIQLLSVENGNVKELIRTYKEYTENEYSRIISLEKIESRNYNLNFTHYDPIYDEMKQMLAQNIGLRISDIVEVVKSGRKVKNIYDNPANHIPIIKQSNLKREIEEIFLGKSNYDDFEYISELNSERILDKKAIIVTLQGKDLKPTIFDPERLDIKKASVGINCLALIPKENINIEYLYYQLYNPRVIRQINGYKRGMTIKRITYNDLLSVVVSKDEYEKQILFVKNQEEPLIELEKYKKLYEDISYKLEAEKVESENRIVNMLIHNVGKHISVIGHDISIIKKVIKDNNLLEYIFDKEEIEKHNSSNDVKNGLLSKKELVSVGVILKRTIDRLNFIEQTFADTQKTVNLNLETVDFQKVNLKEFIINIKKDREINQPLDYGFIIEGDEVFIDINTQSFQEMIHLLINNAEEHAFTKSGKYNDSTCYVKFNIKKLKNRVIIEYTNNGEKFNMNKHDFILAGRKSKISNGSGLGGAYLNRVVISHNGNFDIINTEYGTKFIFNFPIERLGDK